jgi:sugar-specific transcriptional regulator TrmB
MASENTGFIVNYYTTSNGTKLTREQVAERIIEKLNNSPMTCGNIARILKLRKESLYNVLAWMWNQKMVTKKKGDRGIYEYSNIKDCLLSKLFHPSPEEVEKQFKIKDRKHRTIEDGTSKGSGGQKISYGESHYNSVYWGE